MGFIMEEKEKIVQNDVKDVEQNGDTLQKNKKKTIILVSILLILVLAIGLCGGYLLSRQNNKDNTIKETEQKTENKEESNLEVKSNATITDEKQDNEANDIKETENEKESKYSKKIDNSKGWVYDANYGDGKSVKTVTNSEGKVWKSSETLKYPFININSEYANKVNNELKEKYKEQYKYYGGAYAERRIADGYLPEIYYEYAYTDKVLSLVIKEYNGTANGGYAREYHTYNFNLETLEKATFEDVYKECGFNSEKELNEKVDISIYNAIQQEGFFSGDAVWERKAYYMDNNSKFNIIVNDPNSTCNNLEINPNVTKVDKRQNDETTSNTNANIQDQSSREDFSFMQQFEDTFYYKNNNVEPKVVEFYELKFDDKAKPTIKVGTKSEVNTECYFQTKEITNIKADGAAGTVYVTFDFTAFTPGGETTGNATIRYSNVGDNTKIGIKASVDFNDGDITNFDNDGDFIEVEKIY